jgi:hypothetical protein
MLVPNDKSSKWTEEDTSEQALWFPYNTHHVKVGKSSQS